MRVRYAVNQVPYGNQATPKAINEVVALGANSIRFAISWAANNPTPGTIYWSGPDGVYNAALAAGLDVVFVVQGSPPWASGSSNPSFIPVVNGNLNATWLASYSQFFAAVVARYPKALAFQVWNEPNTNYTGSFWQENGSVTATPQAALYRDLFNAAYSAGKAINPKARIGNGALAALTFWSGASATTGINYLNALMADSAMTQPDFVAIHPYTGGSPSPNPMVDNYPHGNSFLDIGRVQAAMLSGGWGRLPLWLTEFGNYSAGAPSSEMIKAQYLTDAFNAINRMYSTTDHARVEFCAYYLLNDPTNGTADTASTGLFTGTPLAGPNSILPSGQAVQTVLATIKLGDVVQTRIHQVLDSDGACSHFHLEVLRGDGNWYLVCVEDPNSLQQLMNIAQTIAAQGESGWQRLIVTTYGT